MGNTIDNIFSCLMFQWIVIKPRGDLARFEAANTPKQYILLELRKLY